MSRDLPLDTDRRLEAVAAGWGREATAANPFCICGKPTGKTSVHLVDAHGRPAPVLGQRRDCPVHRPGGAA